ncbi:Lrp/AsnC family transcriptional regulator [Nocardia sp. NPDC020380]|uniref:Lrp/AsnC family transcriptional regulator n=1 Tax=Nocardia sp. NPDC020380 TaxID=3364309 RepID=UPI0037A05C85
MQVLDSYPPGRHAWMYPVVTAKRPAQGGVDEVDVMLLDALHANPRVSFEKLGPVLGISPATVARRWQRLSESGRAWVSSVPGPSLALTGAVYEVCAQPGRILEVARALADIPQVVSVYATGGRCDLTALVFAGDMPALSVLLLERLPAVPGIASGTAHVGTEWFSGVHWRLGAMDAEQQRSVTEDAEPTPKRATRTRTFGSADHALFLALQRDGRARYRDLAQIVGTSEYAVRRQLDALVRHGILAFRTDFARTEGGWPAEFVLWLAVPQPRLTEYGAELASWSATRICLATVGPSNLMVMVQVHRVNDLAGILARVHDTLPEAVVTDQRLVLRPVKSLGRLLDADGHAVGVVPVDPWASTAVEYPGS